MTQEHFFDRYLSTRGINLDVARKYGVRLVDGNEINRLTGRTDGLRIEAGILIGEVIKPMRVPIHAKDGDAFPDGAWDTPGNEPFCGEWKRRAEGDLDRADPGLHQYQGRLVQKAEDGSVKRACFYPLKTPAGVEVEKFLAPKGQPRSLYIPEPVLGGRPLLVVEGSTRVLAVLSHLNGKEMDLVGLPSSRPSECNLEEIEKLAANATTVTVVLDGDLVNNVDVGHALNRICRRLHDKKDPGKVRVGIPNGDKVGLDDFLATHPDQLGCFLDDCLPWDCSKALAKLKAERWWPEGVLHPARTPDIATGVLLCARQGGLAKYERIRRDLRDLGYESLPHPEPEGRLWRPSAEDIATVAETYVLPYIRHIRVDGNDWARIDDRGLCTIVKNADFAAVVDRRLGDLMGDEPTRQQFGEALHKVQVRAPRTEIATVRRTGETGLSFAEIPLPAPGPMPAWEEFLGRLSCRDTFLAWVHTMTIDGYRGRQALFLKGKGNDGKSTVAELFRTLFGDSGTIVDKATGEERFAWANIHPWTRLVVLDDVKNPNLLYAKRVRQLCAGGAFEVERKGVDVQVVDLHTRVMICANMPLKYKDRAERSRILQVDVSEGIDHSDPTWPPHLRAELPQLLWHAEQAFGHLRKGDSIVPTESTTAIMEQGADAVEAEFEQVLELLEFGSEKTIKAAELMTLAAGCGIREYKYQDLTRLLETRGCKKGHRKEQGRQYRTWSGVGRRRR
jgi:hypothetical protein